MRRDGGAFPGDLAGDSLGQFADRAVVHQKWIFGLAQHVDKAGGDDAVSSINDLGRAVALKLTNGSNTVALDPDVGRVPGIAASVQDVTVADDHIKGRLLVRG